MKLTREINFGDRTANEDWTQKVSSMVENRHSYLPFITYCEAKEATDRKKYFDEEFHLDECRSEIFGPHTGCKTCEGTGWLPVSKACVDPKLRSLWAQAEVDTPTEDGWHLLPCPTCCPLTEELDEHIVKKGYSFELKSKKSGKNLGTYKSKAGAIKREHQVEYFKHLHEHEGMQQWSPDKTPDTRPLPWRLHEDWPLPGHPPDTGHQDAPKSDGQFKRGVSEEIKPSEHNKQQSQEKKDKKKAAETKKDPNASPEDRKEKAKENRAEKESQRKSKKLLPYEFTDQKDAERAAGHLGMHGSHTKGNGIYKPGSSDYSLRDAVARKKSKQKMSGKIKEEQDVTIPYPLDKGNCHEDRDYMHSEDPKTDGNKMAEEVMQKIKECVSWKYSE